jgi:hypothetical protein
MFASIVCRCFVRYFELDNRIWVWFSRLEQRRGRSVGCGVEVWSFLFFFSFFTPFSLYFLLSFLARNGHSYLYEVGKMCGLPSRVKSQSLSPLELIITIDNMPTNRYSQTTLSKVGSVCDFGPVL